MEDADDLRRHDLRGKHVPLTDDHLHQAGDRLSGDRRRDLALVPATMKLLGTWNWWFPRWLDRLVPRLDVEGGHAAEPKGLPAFGEAD